MNLAKFQNSQRQVWLNVGSAAGAIKDFVNVDSSIFLTLLPLYPFLKFLLRPGYLEIIEQYREAKKQAVFVNQDCRKPLKFPEASVDHILCSHFLEHIYPTEVQQVIADFHCVLKKNGRVHVIVPNLEHIVDTYVEKRRIEAGHDAADVLLQETILSSDKPRTWKYHVLELLGYEGLQHRWMYDRASMSRRLQEGGFRLIEMNHCPSASVRLEDGASSLHLLAEKI
jgi:predicted SAM-dependent methyltransferase